MKYIAVVKETFTHHVIIESDKKTQSEVEEDILNQIFDDFLSNVNEETQVDDDYEVTNILTLDGEPIPWEGGSQ